MLADCESNQCEQTQPGNVCNNQADKVVPHEASKDVKDVLIRSLKVYPTLEVLIKTSPPDTLEPSTLSGPCSEDPSSVVPALSSTSPTLLSRSVKKKLGDSVMKNKDRYFISRMIRTLTKLEFKYQVPEHKRKKRLFSRKQRTNPIVPKELASIYPALATPEPEAVAVPDPFPCVWSNEIKV